MTPILDKLSVVKSSAKPVVVGMGAGPQKDRDCLARFCGGCEADCFVLFDHLCIYPAARLRHG